MDTTVTVTLEDTFEIEVRIEDCDTSEATVDFNWTNVDWAEVCDLADRKQWAVDYFDDDVSGIHVDDLNEIAFRKMPKEIAKYIERTEYNTICEQAFVELRGEFDAAEDAYYENLMALETEELW